MRPLDWLWVIDFQHSGTVISDCILNLIWRFDPYCMAPHVVKVFGLYALRTYEQKWESVLVVVFYPGQVHASFST